MTATAQAADMPVRRAAPAAAPVPVVAVYDWTGRVCRRPCRVGLGRQPLVRCHAVRFPRQGLRRRRRHRRRISRRRTDWLQLANGRARALAPRRRAASPIFPGRRRSAFFRTLTNHTDVDSLVTLAGRAGIAHHNWLLFAKVGGAWADSDFRITGVQRARWSQSRDGWMAGGGLEYGVTPNWSDQDRIQLPRLRLRHHAGYFLRAAAAGLMKKSSRMCTS